MYVIQRIQDYSDKTRRLYFKERREYVTSYVKNKDQAHKFETKAEATAMMKKIDDNINLIDKNFYDRKKYYQQKGYTYGTWSVIKV